MIFSGGFTVINADNNLFKLFAFIASDNNFSNSRERFLQSWSLPIYILYIDFISLTSAIYEQRSASVNDTCQLLSNKYDR